MRKNKTFHFRKIENLLKNRKFRRGSVAGCITASVTAIIVIFNIIVSVLAEKFPLSWDLTSNKIFTITEQSKNLIKNLDKDVDITLLNDENSFSESNEYFKQANTVLNQYKKYSDKIKINYIDVVKNPTYIQNNYPNEDLNTNSIIVKCQDRHKVITINYIFDVNYSYYGKSNITASKAEQELSAAIVYVTSNEQSVIAVIKGYDEQDCSGFSEILKKNNYNVADVSILTEEIPDNASAVLIFAPARDFDDTGIEKIKKFLSLGGKSLVFAANPQLSSSSNIDKFLAEWDIKLSDGIIYETNTQNLTSNRSPFEAVCAYAEDKYTENLITVDIPVLMPFCRPIKILNNSENVKTLLQYSETSGIMPADADQSFDFKGNISGPVPSCVMSTKKLNDNDKESNVAVIGSYICLSKNCLSATSINNSQYFINMLNIMTDRENIGIMIESKSLENEELGINATQANILGLVFAVFLPLAIIAAGIVVYFKRKNK